MRETVEHGEKRLKELERLMDKIYENNAFGKIADAEQKTTDLRLLLRTFREMTDIKELTPALVNSLIERIEVHNNDKSSGHSYVKVDIYFTAVGMFKVPTEDEIVAMMEEIRKNPQDYRFAA